MRHAPADLALGILAASVRATESAAEPMSKYQRYPVSARGRFLVVIMPCRAHDSRFVWKLLKKTNLWRACAESARCYGGRRTARTSAEDFLGITRRKIEIRDVLDSRHPEGEWDD